MHHCYNGYRWNGFHNVLFIYWSRERKWKVMNRGLSFYLLIYLYNTHSSSVCKFCISHFQHQALLRRILWLSSALQYWILSDFVADLSFQVCAFIIFIFLYSFGKDWWAWSNTNIDHIFQWQCHFCVLKPRTLCLEQNCQFLGARNCILCHVFGSLIDSFIDWIECFVGCLVDWLFAREL